MHKKLAVKFLSLVLCMAMAVSALSVFGCGGKKKDSVVIMTEALSGLFNPFYATSGSDMEVVGMTQISMLSTDKDGKTVASDDLPTVVKDFKVEENKDKTETVYTFVIKNGIKFSDGKPLTMNDVLFNMYEYLDPVYTGSSTMYSIKIKGLKDYRLQTLGGDSDTESALSVSSYSLANERIRMLRTLYEDNGMLSDNSYKMTEAQMRGAINNLDNNDFSTGYMDAVASNKEQESGTFDYKAKLMADYELTLSTFKKELQDNYSAAQESYDLTTMPYSEHVKIMSNEIFRFLLHEGYIKPEYEKVQGKENKAKIIGFSSYNYQRFKDKNDVIDFVFKDKTENELNIILTDWGTAGSLKTIYSAAAMDVLLHNNAEISGSEGGLYVSFIEGIRSLGHPRTEHVPEWSTADEVVNTVDIKGTTYNVAHNHNADGTPVNSNEYDVLQITVEGADPKAIYNFGFTVAPAHYYSNKTVNIDNYEFGVEFASSDFQRNVIQSQRNVSLPVGAGVFKVTNVNNSDNPGETEFWRNSTVYFKKNDNFMFPVKADKFRMLEISSTNAIDKLDNGEVDYISPQFTKTNKTILDRMVKNGKFGYVTTPQLGYGYIGINAGKVPNHYVRKAIMSAMQASQAIQFYAADTCKVIDWPMSMVSWAYPWEQKGATDDIFDRSYMSEASGKDYVQWTTVEAAKTKIRNYMQQAYEYNPDTYNLKVKFTVAGASITDHPTYQVFKQAAEILREMDPVEGQKWDVEVKADSQALTKLSTGSLEVWAAAWGSTIDPDMYQVYHKDSTASSVYAWGYREIKEAPDKYKYEFDTIVELSAIIDEARQITNENIVTERNLRAAKYKEAMRLVLDLAVEMPVYQRKTAYAYNAKTIRGLVTEDLNAYSSPLERIWELELVK